MYNSNYSNRVLTNVIDPEGLLGRFMIYDGTNVVEYKVVRNKEFKAGLTFNELDNSDGVMIMPFTHLSLFDEIIALALEVPVLFEVYIYNQNEIIESGKYNKFYYFDMVNYLNNPLDNELTLEMTFKKFSGIFETNTIAEHTIEYDFNTLPVDDQGAKILPDDYNIVSYKNVSIVQAMTNLWNMNIGSDISIPVNRCKGDFHINDIDRKVLGIGTLNFVGDIVSETITYTSEKKSILEIREGFAGILRGRDIFEKFVLNTKYNETTQLLDFYFVQNDTIIIDNATQTIKDNFTRLEKEIIISTDLVDILVESTGNDNFSYHDYIGAKPNQWKKLEGLGSASIEEGGTALDMKDNATDIAGNNDITDNTNLEIFFKEKAYFKDIHAGQIVEISNFGDVVDGVYLIKQISAVYEDSYISYAIDVMERIRGGLI